MRMIAAGQLADELGCTPGMIMSWAKRNPYLSGAEKVSGSAAAKAWYGPETAEKVRAKYGVWVGRWVREAESPPGLRGLTGDKLEMVKLTLAWLLQEGPMKWTSLKGRLVEMEFSAQRVWGAVEVLEPGWWTMPKKGGRGTGPQWFVELPGWRKTNVSCDIVFGDPDGE